MKSNSQSPLSIRSGPSTKKSSPGSTYVPTRRIITRDQVLWPTLMIVGLVLTLVGAYLLISPSTRTMAVASPRETTSMTEGSLAAKPTKSAKSSTITDEPVKPVPALAQAAGQGSAPGPVTTLPPSPAPNAAPTSAPAPVAVPGAATPTALLETTPATSPAATSPVTQPEVTSQELALRVKQGLKLIEDGKPIEARATLSYLLTQYESQLSPQDAQAIRDTLTSVNQGLIFSTRIETGDPFTKAHRVTEADGRAPLSKIARENQITYQLIEWINKVDARRIALNRSLKVVKGPFHVVVRKASFRLDVFLLGEDNRPIYVRSYPIGLGEGDSTPEGKWVVDAGGKVIDPTWTNPRTGEIVGSKDVKNPLGGYWIRLRGTEEKTRDLHGYGIHGTNEPQSIGKQMSMGCIRLRNEDISQLYKLLVERQSTVEIRP